MQGVIMLISITIILRFNFEKKNSNTSFCFFGTSKLVSTQFLLFTLFFLERKTEEKTLQLTSINFIYMRLPNLRRIARIELDLTPIWPWLRFYFYHKRRLYSNKAWLHLPLADISLRTTLSDTLWPRITAFCPEHPEWDQNPQFLSLSETTSIHFTLIWEYPLGKTPYPVY